MPDDLMAAARELEGESAEAILAWAFGRYRRVALVASFQAESIVLTAQRHRGADGRRRRHYNNTG